MIKSEAERRKFNEAVLATFTEISRASPGDEVVYHVGELSRDCILGEPLKTAAARGHREGAWMAHLAGACALAQRRVAKNIFQYIAQPSNQTRKP